MPVAKRVAILVADGFVHDDFMAVQSALLKLGFLLELVAPSPGAVRSWRNEIWGEDFYVDSEARDVTADDYDGLVIADGILSIDRLRLDGDAVSFVREFFELGKPIAAVGHAPQLFVDAQVLEGQVITSNPAIELDISNAGGSWQNLPVVGYSQLITAQDERGLTELVVRFVDSIEEEHSSHNHLTSSHAPV